MNAKEFQVSNLVLRKNIGSMIDPTDGKLGANWEGPYTVIEATGTGAYYLKIKKVEIFKIHGIYPI